MHKKNQWNSEAAEVELRYSKGSLYVHNFTK